ncbi:YhcG family protein [Parapedobacter sp. 2B3]|uniref:PDDEXK nuclease domain-containing protein n=1 Tax=Parapedobacter sp. 2B3 TaxID=3342381 RepID=UPI0035B59952
MELASQREYQALVNQISVAYEEGRQRAIQTVNTQLVQTYWEIGQYIVEFEQAGEARAKYGKALINTLAVDLSKLHGRGFSRSNLIYMRLLYLEYPISEKPSHLLSWSHYVELLKIDDKLERSFYEKQAIIEKWSIPELKRQKKSSLYLRLAASKDKDGILLLAKQGQVVSKPDDIVRDPYILDFLKIPEPHHYTESELESRIIEHLQHFLLELGKGFAFIGRQYRITLGNRHHYVDLVFYHRILKCFVLIDLKREEAGYEDVGQMNMYLGYFENEENTEGDNPPIGIVLAKEKDELLIQYAMHNVSSQLFVSKYQLYLPKKEELRSIIEAQLDRDSGD